MWDDKSELNECIRKLKAAAKEVREDAVRSVYVPNVLDAAAVVDDGPPDDYHEVITQIRVHVGRDGIARWERAIRKRRKVKQVEEPVSPTFSLMDFA